MESLALLNCPRAYTVKDVSLENVTWYTISSLLCIVYSFLRI